MGRFFQFVTVLGVLLLAVVVIYGLLALSGHFQAGFNAPS